MKPVVNASTVLIIVDVQNDFCADGALAVPGGDEVVPALNRVALYCEQKRALVVASRDWHPPNHCSFKQFGGIWPPHCVHNTKGAAFHPDLDLPPELTLVSKGTAVEKDAYSAFEGTELGDLLEQRRISSVLVGGLATDYCVLNTTLDAIRRRHRTYLLTDACRAVNVNEGDGDAALSKMFDAGAIALTTTSVEEG